MMTATNNNGQQQTMTTNPNANVKMPCSVPRFGSWWDRQTKEGEVFFLFV
jgi:hypothetical protein